MQPNLSVQPDASVSINADITFGSLVAPPGPGGAFNQAGTVTWSDGNISLRNGYAINNFGSWFDNDDLRMSGGLGGGGSFVNQGLFQKGFTAGTTTFLNVSFFNKSATQGVVVNNGTLALAGRVGRRSLPDCRRGNVN